MPKTPEKSVAWSLRRSQAEADTALSKFLNEVFHQEQEIPEHLIPLGKEAQKWWYLEKPSGQVVGAVAVWHRADGWHWGRFALATPYRGQGLGKKLALLSFREAFSDEAICLLRIEARDITVSLLEKLGGRKTGAPKPFYVGTVTPMTLSRQDFQAATSGHPQSF